MIKITSTICNDTYDFAIQKDPTNNTAKASFYVTLGDQILIVSPEEWAEINELVTTGMDFITDNDI